MSLLRSRTAQFLALLFTAVLSTAAVQAQTEISVDPPVPLVDEDFSLTVSGTWRDGCGPVVETIVRPDPDSIQIWLRSRDEPGIFCFQALIDYELTFSDKDLPPRTGPGVYRIEVVVMTGEDEQYLDAFRLIELKDPDDSRVLTPESGAWWAERGGRFETSGPGSGFSIDTQNGVMTAILHVYDDRGEQQWLIAAGELQGRAFRAELFHTAQGQPLFGDYKPPESVDAVGWLDMELISPSRAEAWITRSDGSFSAIQRQAVSLTRFLFASSPDESTWIGDWVLVDEHQGTGFQQITLDEVVETSDDGFTLQDSQRGHQLTCIQLAERPETLPQRCDLVLSGDDTVRVFDAIGYDRSRGNGVQLIRLSDRNRTGD